MTKTQLQKIKELDAFLKKRKMELRGNDVIVGFNRHKDYNIWEDEEFVQLNLEIGLIRKGNANIQELNELPKVKEHYYVDKNGKLKSYE